MKKKIERQTTKTTIRQSDYYALEGLAHLAKKHQEYGKKLEQSVIDITGEKTEVWNGGHSGDFCYGDMSVKELLDKLDLKVKK